MTEGKVTTPMKPVIQEPTTRNSRLWPVYEYRLLTAKESFGKVSGRASWIQDQIGEMNGKRGADERRKLVMRAMEEMRDMEEMVKIAKIDLLTLLWMTQLENAAILPEPNETEVDF